MKKLIIGLMLVMGSLSFASQEDRGLQGVEFKIENTKTELSQNVVANVSNEDVLFGLTSNQRNL